MGNSWEASVAARGPATKLVQKCRRSYISGGGSDGVAMERVRLGKLWMYLEERAEKNYCWIVVEVGKKERT